MMSTRFAGLDGVSLESAKVAEALERSGHDIVWYAGELAPEFAPGTRDGLASFRHAEVLALQQDVFGGGTTDDLEALVYDVADRLAPSVESFIDDHRPDVLVVQNAWAIPMHLPLAVAIQRAAEERSLPAIGHHHDFSWERPRFAECALPGLLDEYFPPISDGIAHIVINSDARDDLEARTGVRAAVLPNVMDFTIDPPDHDGGRSFRQLAGVAVDDIVLLQPTRIIRRKGIELSIELAGGLGVDAKLIVTHPDDLDAEYWEELRQLAGELSVDMRLVDPGRSLESLASAYAAADLVCFPSLYEGFGNALVEAFYHRRPVFVNRYSVYARDIAPLGVACIEIDGAVTPDSIAKARAWVADRESSGPATETNAGIGLRHFSYDTADATFTRAFADLGLA